MANPIAKYITKSVVTALTKRGAPTSGQKATITKAAKNADMSVAEFKKEAKKIIKNETTPKNTVTVKKSKSKATNLTADLTDLTKAEKAERSRLIAQSKKDAEIAKLEREGVSLEGEEPELIKLTAGGTEVLPSKEQIDPEIRNYSKARIRHLIMTGQAEMVVDKNGKRSIRTTGKFASPRSMVAKKMGLGGRGTLATEEELKAVGGYQIRKKGGAIKRNKGGAVRGVGQAIKGFGNAKYSKKMY